MAHKLLNRSIKENGSRDWIEQVKPYQGQDLATEMHVNLMGRNTCLINNDCSVAKYLVRVSEDARAGCNTPNQCIENYYAVTYASSASFLETRSITKDEASHLDKDFVRTNDKMGR